MTITVGDTPVVGKGDNLDPLHAVNIRDATCTVLQDAQHNNLHTDPPTTAREINDHDKSIGLTGANATLMLNVMYF